ncbi:MAG TPA: secondary thiamine-phosphate synthase enzyme YjbQ [Caulobacteraceae bacterium]|nr:secondary thiamine-phosphate synthase enzyme YjbQ [Caulobacteraceae bacterium]
MRQAATIIRVRTPGPGLVEVTAEICDWTRAQEIRTGLLSLFCRHTSASLLIQENYSADVRADLEAFFERLAPEGPGYAHQDEGPDDMPSHIRTAVGGVTLAIPVVAGAPALGAWQGIFLFEHRRAPHERQIAAHLIGE